MVTRVQRALDDEAPRAQLSATVDVARSAHGYRAVLRLHDQEYVGERTLEHAQCDVLGDSVALVIALSASSSEERASGTPLSLALSAHGIGVTGPLPELALGAGLSVALEGALSLRWELSGSYFAGQSATYPQTDVGADFRMFRLAARSCRVWKTGSVDLAPCLGVALHRVDGRGFGGMVRKTGGAFVWGPELSMLVRWRLARHFAVQLSAGASLPVSRQRFTYNDLGLLHRPAAVAYQLMIAPEVLF